MYGYDSYYGTTPVVSTTSILTLFGGYFFFASLVGVFMIVCMWKIFTKSKQEGWKSIVPIYNIIVLLQIVNLPLWYIILFIVPFVNIYVLFKIYIELAHKFGKSTGFGVASVFFNIVCLPILAFGSATYEGTTNSDSNIEQNNNKFSNNDVSEFNNVQPVPSQDLNTQVSEIQSQDIFDRTVQQPMNNTIVSTPVESTVILPNEANVNSIFDETVKSEETIVNTINDGFAASNVNSSIPETNQGFFDETVQPQNNIQSVTNVPSSLNYTEPVATETIVNSQPTVSIKFCTNCGTKLDGNIATCFMCGKQQ